MSSPDLGVRYRAQTLLGRGASAEVWRVVDEDLQRVVAMKILLKSHSLDERARRRFGAEARVIAGLQHPGIVPLYDCGQLPDARLYYTMKEVMGQTLGALLREGGCSQRRGVELLLRGAEAVAFAHSHGILHRDIKPQNLMVGSFGEVLVLDWGLALALGADEGPGEEGTSPRLGAVTGTPAYMAPEQARGELHRLSPRTDVYALGSVLYEIVAGRPPYSGGSAWEVTLRVLAGPPPPLERVAAGRVDAELGRIVAIALARAPEDRYENAGALATAIADWLDGARRREQALAEVARADALLPRVRALRAGAVRLRAEAQGLLADVLPSDPVERKRPAWRLQQEAEAREHEAEGLEREATGALRGALFIAPDLEEAHQRLADHHLARHAAAEARRDRATAADEEALLRFHDHGRHAGYLRGDGTLTLFSDPPGARARLHVFEHDEDRRLVLRFVRDLGPTPIRELPLAMGSYGVVLTAPGHADVLYPVWIRRQERWDGVPPGESSALPIPLPRVGELGPEDHYVPAGWFWAGGDPECPASSDGQRRWVDGFILRRFQVTNAEYMVFLQDLFQRGRVEQALVFAPRYLPSPGQALGTLMVGFDAERGFAMPADWLPDGPVLNIDWAGASAFAAWTAARDGLPWRLPGEWEREKATRGVDGRAFPWGEVFDPTWTCMRESRAGAPMRPPSVHDYPGDESPYGVRNLAGLSRDWCSDLWQPDGPPRPGGPSATVITSEARIWRGASWLDHAVACRAAGRSWGPATDRYSRLGVRLARSWPPSTR